MASTWRSSPKVGSCTAMMRHEGTSTRRSHTRNRASGTNCTGNGTNCTGNAAACVGFCRALHLISRRR
eukprot:60444-Rhodomonas_salina.1